MNNIKDHLGQELTATNALRKFTDNNDVIGAHAEAVVRQMIERVVAPLTVWHGGIIDFGICPKNVPELDAIIALPVNVPPLFAVNDFALVPGITAMGFLEIKSTAYTNVGTKIKEKLDREADLIQQSLFRPASLGVICLRQQPKNEKSKDGTYTKGYVRKDETLDKLVEEKRVVVLINEQENGMLKPDGDAIFLLLNFLASVRNAALRYAVFVDTKIGYPQNLVPPPQAAAGSGAA